MDPAPHGEDTPRSGEDKPRPSKPTPQATTFLNDARLRKAERLLDPREFTRTQRRGQRQVTPALIAIVLKGEQPWTRVGITVSRKVGNAVVRNKVKRRLRSIFRAHKATLPIGYDLVWIARREAATTPYDELARQAVQGSLKATQHKRRGQRSNRNRSHPKPGNPST